MCGCLPRISGHRHVSERVSQDLYSLCGERPGYEVSDLFVVCVPGCEVCEWPGGAFCRTLCP